MDERESELGSVDTGFDFRSERPAGKDPDSWSPTLLKYHRILWSKPLPGGEFFDLTEAGKPGSFHLRHESALGSFRLSSDAITHRYLRAPVVKQVPTEDLPPGAGYTIGSALIFPGNRIDGRQTINQARGTHPRIRDRFDLTLECIRRYYGGEQSPLAAVLERYADFFSLFGDFDGYVDFFMLQDLVGEDGAITFLHHFDNFTTPPVPNDAKGYLAYRQRSSAFITARNRRIQAHLASRPTD